jgi:hypothetical protein
MPTKQSDTGEQIRSLMSRHTANTPVLSPPSPPKTPAKLVGMSAPQPKVGPSPIVEAKPHSRHTLKLMQSELEKINTIIHNTIQQTGERATVTDVLRNGLKRLGDSTYISAEEMKALRVADGRRAKPQAPTPSV